tara:strand:+ start:810 stop:1031 length:222 start_codon:yes stop_codon:yes gene_type:complete
MKKLITIIFISSLILFGCTSGKLVVPESEGEKLSILYADALKKQKRKIISMLQLFLRILKDNILIQLGQVKHS